MNLGNVRIDVLNDGFWRVDGGAMYGVRSAIVTVHVCPIRSHLERLPWMPGVDLEPLVSMETKRALIAEILNRDRIVIFDHDPEGVVARLTGTVDRWEVEVVECESLEPDDLDGRSPKAT